MSIAFTADKDRLLPRQSNSRKISRVIMLTFLPSFHDLVPVPKVTQRLPALLVLYVEPIWGCVLKLHFEILSKQWETCFSPIFNCLQVSVC